jgi:hypothetical protein
MKQTEIVAEDLQKTGDYLVTLANVGNPDHGQHPGKVLPGTRNSLALARTLTQASTLCTEYIRINELGGGNWAGGEVRLDGVIVARVSYNGRVWLPDLSPHLSRTPFSASKQ